MSHHKRLKLVERKVLNPDRLVAILPDYLADGEQPKPIPGERVITPNHYMAYDEETNEVYFYER